jgi:alpha-glucosidase
LIEQHERFSVSAEDADAGSSLTLYRKLLALRRSSAALRSGTISEVKADDGVLSYMRSDGTNRVQVLLNLTGEPRQADAVSGRLALNSFLDRNRTTTGGRLSLRPNEALIVEAS